MKGTIFGTNPYIKTTPHKGKITRPKVTLPQRPLCGSKADKTLAKSRGQTIYMPLFFERGRTGFDGDS
jgi:hypothetical protein